MLCVLVFNLRVCGCFVCSAGLMKLPLDEDVLVCPWFLSSFLASVPVFHSDYLAPARLMRARYCGTEAQSHGSHWGVGTRTTDDYVYHSCDIFEKTNFETKLDNSTSLWNKHFIFFLCTFMKRTEAFAKYKKCFVALKFEVTVNRRWVFVCSEAQAKLCSSFVAWNMADMTMIQKPFLTFFFYL